MGKDKNTLWSFLTMESLMLLHEGHYTSKAQNEGKQDKSH